MLVRPETARRLEERGFAFLAGIMLATAAAGFASGIWVAAHRSDPDAFMAQYALGGWARDFHAVNHSLAAILVLVWLQAVSRPTEKKRPWFGAVLLIVTIAVPMWLAWLGQPESPPMSELQYWLHIFVGGIGLIAALWMALRPMAPSRRMWSFSKCRTIRA